MENRNGDREEALEEELRDRDGMADTKPELAIMEEEGEHYEPEGIVDTSLPVEPHDGSSEDKGSRGPPPISSVSGPHGEAGELMHSMSRLLEAQTQMMAMQASAVAAQNLPPMPRLTGPMMITSIGGLNTLKRGQS